MPKLKLSLTKNQFLLLINISLLALSILVGLYIISDFRLNILGESHGAHLKAISIAISRLVYGIDGLAGLEQVLHVLNEIPSISTLSFNNTESYENFHLLINNTIQKSLLLENIETTQLHGMLNDQSYLYYVIIAFFLFGIKIKSLTFMWLLLFYISLITYILAYKNNGLNLFILWCFLIAISIIVVSNPGIGNQIISIYNYRFITILGLIPLLHIILSSNNSRKSVTDWTLIFIQATLLVSVLLMRGSAQWMLIAIAISIIYFIWNNKSYSSITRLKFQMAPLVLIIFSFIVIKNTIPHFLNKEYEKSIWTTTHAMWHPMVVGLTNNPVLFNKYVCTKKPLNDTLNGFYPIICEENIKLTKKEKLIHSVFDPPMDMYSFHAAVKYLREKGSDEQIGVEIENKNHFNINWDKYDEVSHNVYFNIILNDPAESLYMYLIAKPLRYYMEAKMYLKYFTRSMLNSNVSFIIMFIFAIAILLHFYFIAGCLNLTNTKSVELFVYIIIMFISSLVPSILFYSQAYTITDSVAVIIIMILFSPLVFIQFLKNIKLTSVEVD